MLIKPLFPRTLLNATHAKHSAHPYGEDTFFLLKLLSSGASFVYIPQAMYLYRISANSASNNPLRYQMLIDVIETCLPDFQYLSKTQAALRKKIATLKNQKIRFEFTSAVRRRRAMNALRIFLHRPCVLTDVAAHIFTLLKKKFLSEYH